MERNSSSIQVGIGLADVRVAEQFLDVMQRHARFEPMGTCLASQVVEVKGRADVSAVPFCFA